MRILTLVAAVLFAAPQAAVEPMTRFDGATFVMGTDAAAIDTLMARFQVKRRELFLSEVPAHNVELHAFSLDRTEVTNAQFKAWSSQSFPQGEDNVPAVFVTKPAAIAFCQSQGKRLPTEAEWEFAASNGGRSEFPWGDEMPDASRANWLGAAQGKPVRVASFPPTRTGVYDLAGNVWEFVQETWEGSTDRSVIRGGSFGGAAVNLRARFRDSHPVNGAGPHVGFRCARS